MIRLCTILWLMVRSQDGVTGATVIHPWDPVGLGAAVLVVIKSLTSSIWWVVFTSVKQLRKCDLTVLSGYFTEELQQRLCGGPGVGGSVLERPIGSC